METEFCGGAHRLQKTGRCQEPAPHQLNTDIGAGHLRRLLTETTNEIRKPASPADILLECLPRRLERLH
jgi:hypothetical protein